MSRGPEICVIGDSKGKETGWRIEKIFEELMDKNPPKLIKKKKHKPMDPTSSPNSKHKKHEENCIKEYYNITLRNRKS